MNSQGLLLRDGQAGFGPFLNELRQGQGCTNETLAVAICTPPNIIQHRVGQLKRLWRSECKNLGLLFAVCDRLHLRIPFALHKAGWDPEKP